MFNVVYCYFAVRCGSVLSNSRMPNPQCAYVYMPIVNTIFSIKPIDQTSKPTVAERTNQFENKYQKFINL